MLNYTLRHDAVCRSGSTDPRIVNFVSRWRKYDSVSKSFRTGRLERELQMVQLSATRCNRVAVLWVSLVTFAAVTLCVASQWVFIVVYIVIDSVRKLLDMPSNITNSVRLFSKMVFKYEAHFTIYSGARIAQWYRAGLRAGRSGVRVQAGAGNFSLRHHFRTGSGAHPASYPMGIRGSFPGEKACGAWSWPITSI
jgi:hypothetical protein